jgi:hypothetical protein
MKFKFSILLLCLLSLNALGVEVPETNCGVSGNIEERIFNCNTKYDGAPDRNGDWVLVSKIDKFQIWRDERTGLIWSDLIESNSKRIELTNCEASGNTEIQDEIPFCKRTLTSACEERQGFLPAIPDENWKRSLYSKSKGEMGKNSVTPIYWKLPTAKDFRTADINGATEVLPRLANAFWTSTFYSNINSSSYFAALVPRYGQIGFALESRSTKLYVRCVGNL